MAEVVTRARRVNVHTLILDSLQTDIDRVRAHAQFMVQLRTLVERDLEMLVRFAEQGRILVDIERF